MGYDPNWTPEQLAQFKEERNRKMREKRALEKKRRLAMERAAPKDLTSREKRNLYLTYLEEGMKRTAAAEKVGVKYATVKYWRKADAKFREEEASIEDAYYDKLEDVLHQALEDRGTVKDIVDILERKRPEIWGKKSVKEVNHTYQFSGTDAERIKRVTELVSQVRVLRPELPLPVLDAELVEDS